VDHRVDNKPGAGGNIGLDAAAKSPPDGYTIAMGRPPTSR
jgi:tripartite-type tricarboxylate transporter receptor subunit TctC